MLHVIETGRQAGKTMNREQAVRAFDENAVYWAGVDVLPFFKAQELFPWVADLIGAMMGADDQPLTKGDTVYMSGIGSFFSGYSLTLTGWLKLVTVRNAKLLRDALSGSGALPAWEVNHAIWRNDRQGDMIEPEPPTLS